MGGVDVMTVALPMIAKFRKGIFPGWGTVLGTLGRMEV